MKYYLKKYVDLSYEKAIERVKEELKKVGFGVLTEIDAKATMKAKLNKDMKEYIILGACNPNFAHQALEFQKEIGLLLPCNVIVYLDENNKTVVSAIDPTVALKIVGEDSIVDIASEVKNSLNQVLENL